MVHKGNKKILDNLTNELIKNRMEDKGQYMKIENTEVWGFEHAFRGMRNPMNSWDKSDSDRIYFDSNWLTNSEKIRKNFIDFGVNHNIGKNDMKLAQRLILSGGEHRKFLRMIHVSADIDMPRYWWSEEDTYHFNTKNSCSTMHKLLNNTKPITKELFVYCKEDEDVVEIVIQRLEQLRQEYRNSNDYNDQTRLLVRAKRLLMEGFLQMRTLDTNYEELRNEYFQRRNHRLKEEWVDTFCKWIESLPYAAELICYTGE